MINIWQYMHNNVDLVILGGILIVVFVLFIRDFDLTSKNSWKILLGLSVLGGLIFYREIKKKQLLKELEKRENRIKELEDNYKKLKEKNEISEKNYKDAKSRLDEAKKKVAMDLLSADEKYNEEILELEKEMVNTSPDDMILRARKILNNNQ